MTPHQESVLVELTATEFDQHYTTRAAPDGGSLWAPHQADCIDPHHLWTLTETDTGALWVVSGLQLVDRVDHIVTNQPWTALTIYPVTAPERTTPVNHLIDETRVMLHDINPQTCTIGRGPALHIPLNPNHYVNITPNGDSNLHVTHWQNNPDNPHQPFHCDTRNYRTALGAATRVRQLLTTHHA